MSVRKSFVLSQDKADLITTTAILSYAVQAHKPCAGVTDNETL